MFTNKCCLLRSIRHILTSRCCCFVRRTRLRLRLRLRWRDSLGFRSQASGCRLTLRFVVRFRLLRYGCRLGRRRPTTSIFLRSRLLPTRLLRSLFLLLFRFSVTLVIIFLVVVDRTHFRPCFFFPSSFCCDLRPTLLALSWFPFVSLLCT